MGQQQILLIVLALIIVGAAIVSGIILFGTNAVMANRDSISAELHTLAAIAMQYYLKPAEIGGGGNSFTNWLIPEDLDSTIYGRYRATPNNQSVRIIGLGTEIGDDQSTAVRLTVIITKSDITMSVQN